MTALLKAPTVRKLQAKLGYTFKNSQYLWEAVQAPGSISHPDEVPSAAKLHKFPNGNKRLALLGDTILKLAILEDWYKGPESRGTAMSISDPERNSFLSIRREDKPLYRKHRRKPKSHGSRPLKGSGRAH